MKKRRNGLKIESVYSVNGDINVTPFIDVMLVLLIIFIIASPMITQGIKLDVPNTKGASPINDQENSISVIVSEETKVVIDDNSMDIASITKHLQHLSMDPSITSIFIRGDKGISYGVIAKIIDAIQLAGFNRIAMITNNSMEDD